MSNLEFDNLFRKKLDAEEFAFQAGAWSQAEQLLDADKAGRMRWKYFRAGLLFLGGIATAGLLFYFLPNNNQSLADRSGPSLFYVASMASPDVLDDPSRTIEAKDTESTQAIDTRKSSTTTTVLASSASLPTSMSVTENTNRNTSFTSQGPDRSPVSKAGLRSSQLFEVNHVPALATRAVEQINLNISEWIDDETTAIGIDPMSVEEQLLQASDNLSLTSASAERMNVEPIERMATLSIASNDRTGLQLHNTPSKIRLKMLNRGQWSLNAGMSVGQGFAYDNLSGYRDPITTGYFAGLSYTYRLKKVYLSGSLLFHQQNGGSVTVLKKEYGFGSQTNETQISSQAQQLNIPILIGYSIGRHNILAGAQYSRLLNGAFSHRHIVQGDAGEALGSGYEEKDYSKFLSSVDIALVIGYDLMLNERFDLGLRYNHGFYDMTNSTAIVGEETDDRNRQVRFSINYKLFGL